MFAKIIPHNVGFKCKLISCLLWTAFMCVGCGVGEADYYTASDTQELMQKTTMQEIRQNVIDPAETDLPDEQNMEGQEEAAFIYVQVCGAVHNPGVYQLDKGERIFCAIEMAGGMTAEAYTQAINQAAVAEDGQMIYVYSVQEWEQRTLQAAMSEQAGSLQDIDVRGCEEQASDQLVNINTADFDRLKTISGIGDVLSQRIIAYREQHGPYESIEDIKKVSGIGETLFQKIKAYIKV